MENENNVMPTEAEIENIENVPVDKKQIKQETPKDSKKDAVDNAQKKKNNLEI